MKRRDFIKMSAGLGAAMATTTPLSPAFAQTKMVLKAADVHPLGYPTVEAVARGWARSSKPPPTAGCRSRCSRRCNSAAKRK